MPRGTQISIEEKLLTEVGFEKYSYDVSGFIDRDLKIMIQLINNMIKKLPYSIKIRTEVIEKVRMERDYVEKSFANMKVS